MINILGLDPGFAKLGWSKTIYDHNRRGLALDIVEMDLFTTQKSDKKRSVRSADDNFRRTQEVVRLLDGLFAWADVVVAEEMSSVRNAATMRQMGMVWGVIATLAEIYEHPVVVIPVKTIKVEIAHEATASKEDVMEGVNQTFGFDVGEKYLASVPEKQRDHPYDGLAATLCSLKTDVVRMAVKASRSGE